MEHNIIDLTVFFEVMNGAEFSAVVGFLEHPPIQLLQIVFKFEYGEDNTTIVKYSVQKVYYSESVIEEPRTKVTQLHFSSFEKNAKN